MTTTTLHVAIGPDAVQQIGGQVARAIRRYGIPTTVRQPAPAAVPFRHADLFREPVYADGQPYAEDQDLADDGEL